MKPPPTDLDPSPRLPLPNPSKPGSTKDPSATVVAGGAGPGFAKAQTTSGRSSALGPNRRPMIGGPTDGRDRALGGNAAARPPRISEYTDFRVYLQDHYGFKRKQYENDVRPYSYAHFSASADIKSPNYLKLIIEGSRNLSLEMIKKFSTALGHSKEEHEEFEALVLYGQAQSPLERNQHLRRLSELRVSSQIRSGQLRPEVFEKIPSWVTWVLYAMVDQKGVDFDIEQLRHLMKNRASLDEIRKSLDKLLETGELVRDGSGRIKKGKALFSGGEEIPVELVRKLQSELIYLGLESLFQDRPQDREFGALTLSLTEQEFEQLKFELRQLRKRWFKDFNVNRLKGAGDRVFQLNIQLFPVTRSGPKEPPNESGGF